MHDDSLIITDDWVLERRPTKNAVDAARPYASLVEPERQPDGTMADVATIFLTNRECPFRCLMCDLWKNTTDERVSAGAIPEQIRWALSRLPAAPHVKLYNSGSFFDPQAVPESDYPEIATLVLGFDTVVVESHPRMIGRRCFAFDDIIAGQLEVAIGLETVHPDVLAKLNKRMTTAEFARAVATLTERGIRVRTFILLRPPWMSESEGVLWAKRSIDFAFDAGVECCAIIPTRGGNGAMEYLADQGVYHPPTVESLEEVMAYGVSLRRGRVLADMWDIQEFDADTDRTAARIERLRQMNEHGARAPTLTLTTTDHLDGGSTDSGSTE